MPVFRVFAVLLLVFAACGSPPADEGGPSDLPEEEGEILPPEEEEEPPPPEEEEEEEPPPPPPPPEEEEEEEPPPPPPPEEEEEEEPPPPPPPEEEEGSTDDPIDLARPSRALASRAIFEATNEARTAEGLPPLEVCELCVVAAQGHADDMERLNFSAHENPDPERRTPGMRLEVAGVDFTRWAENIGYHSVRRGSGTYSYRALAESMVEWWMSSPGHRDNILWSEVTHLGAACTLELDGSYPRLLCVQNFVRLRSSR